nr:30S ribosome-binding factor RbfA [candidate division Zixibacteria bacterium]
MRQYKRSDRVRQQILRDVQQLLEHECATNLKGMVTFTEVALTDDLKYATIYYSVLGNDHQKDEASEYFDRIRNRVRSQLARLIRLKQTPEISFKYDPSIERGMRIEQLLNDISSEHDSDDDD